MPRIASLSPDDDAMNDDIDDIDDAPVLTRRPAVSKEEEAGENEPTEHYISRTKDPTAKARAKRAHVAVKAEQVEKGDKAEQVDKVDKADKTEKPEKKGKAVTPKSDSEEPVNGDAEEGNEYEVEQILNHKFERKKCWYSVRWKGYTSKDDTWEPEEHLLPDSKELLAEYHRKIGGAPQPDKPSARKSGSKANLKEAAAKEEDEDAATPPAKRSKRSHKAGSTAVDPNSKEWHSQPMGAWQPTDKANWEDLVHEVETVERDENGNLYAFIRFRNGKRSKVANNMYTSRCPRAMLRFYESHLSV